MVRPLTTVYHLLALFMGLVVWECQQKSMSILTFVATDNNPLFSINIASEIFTKKWHFSKYPLTKVAKHWGNFCKEFCIASIANANGWHYCSQKNYDRHLNASIHERGLKRRQNLFPILTQSRRWTTSTSTQKRRCCHSLAARPTWRRRSMQRCRLWPMLRISSSAGIFAPTFSWSSPWLDFRLKYKTVQISLKR